MMLVSSEIGLPSERRTNWVSADLSQSSFHREMAVGVSVADIEYLALWPTARGDVR